MTLKTWQNILHNLTKIIYMVMLSLDIFQRVDLRSWILQNVTLINMKTTVPDVSFLNMIPNILKNYMSCTLIILYHQVKYKPKNKCLNINYNWYFNIADDYKISIGNVQKLVANLFHKENYVRHSKNLQLYLKQGLKTKKYTPCVRIWSIKTNIRNKKISRKTFKNWKLKT